MGNLINVAKIVEEKKEILKKDIEDLNKNNIFPKLAIILANDIEASRRYIAQKTRLCKDLGIDSVEYVLDSKCSQKDILDIVDRLNKDESVQAILVQLPLFKHLDEKKIIESIDPKKDVDGLTPYNLGKLMTDSSGIICCTPKGILHILKSINTQFTSKHAVIVGRSMIVGRPMAQLLVNENATVTICHSKTDDLKKYTKTADILIVATGVPHLITADMVKKDAIVIDVGINKVDGKLIGDVDTKGVLEIAKYVSPVPGGVGLTTVLSLISNLVDICKKIK